MSFGNRYQRNFQGAGFGGRGKGKKQEWLLDIFPEQLDVCNCHLLKQGEKTWGTR